jgi:hypothetical protein
MDAMHPRMPSDLYSGFYSGDEIREIYPERYCPGVSQFEIRAKWAQEGGEAPFVKCGARHPDYVSMTPDESAYYFYWRSMVRKGKYLRSSEGYLFLFTAEIINTDEDAERNLRMLANVVRVYGSMDPFLLDSMADACITYARIHRLKEPIVTRSGDFTVASHLITGSLSEDPIALIPQGVASRLLFASDRQFLDTEHPYGELYTECLRRIEAHELQNGGRRIVASFGKLKRSQYDIYEGFPYFGTRSRVGIESLDLTVGSKARDFLRVTLKMLIRTVRVRERKTAPLPVMYPSTYRRIISDTVEDWANGRWKTDDLEKSDLILDIRRVSAARSDLDAVSVMISSEHAEEDEETIDYEVPAGKDDDPWKAFFSMLDDIQRGYLRAAMEGGADRYLKGTGIRMSSVEEGINTIAMDTVGDAVVEDGLIYDEYKEELNRVI